MEEFTAQNNGTAPDFDPSEFAPLQLLEKGDVDVWVRRRGAILLNKSKETARECEAGKLASAITVGASVVMSANPLAWVPMVIGAVGYVYTVFQEYQDTGSIRLIPMYRGKLGDILKIMEGGNAEERHPLLDQIEYLSEAEKDEVLLINYRFGEIAGVLSSAPPKTRFDLYQHLCSQFHARRDLMSGDEVKHYINAAVSEERRTTAPPPLPAGEKPEASLPVDEPAPGLADANEEEPSEAQPTEPKPAPALPEENNERTSEAQPTEPKSAPPLTGANDEKPSEAQLTEPKPVPRPQTPQVSKNWLLNFVSQTALIWGNQGSGKSWIVRLLAQLKKEKGYRVVILDPDSNKSEWKGLESYHDIEEIADFIRSYVEELKARYKAFSSSDISEDEWRAKLWQEGKALAIICEEVTTYTDLIDDRKLLTQFFRLGLTKSRKQEMPLTLVSHNNTQKALGNIEGLSNLIEKMLQLELQTDIDPETLQPVASGRGAVKLDGSTHWLPVTLPKLERKITQFDGDRPPLAEPSEPSEPSEPTEPSSEKLAEPTEPSSEKLAEPTEAERLNALLNKQFSGSAEPEPPITEPLNLDPFVPGITNQERGAVVSLRRANASIMTILYLVWSAKKGGNKAYQAARAKLDQILKEAGLS